MSRGRRFASNVGWSLAGQAGTIAINFFTIPYLLRGFGSEAYGVYLLIFAVSSYLGLFQFGAGMAAIKFIASARACGEDRALKDALRHSAVIHFGGVGAASLALWCAAGVLTQRVFEVPHYYRLHALWLLRAAALGGFFSAGLQWSSSAFQGLQKFAWPSALGLLQSILMPLGLVTVLAVGRGLGAAAGWYVFVQAALCALGAGALYWEVRAFNSNRGHLDFMPFARYGFPFCLAALSGVASTQIDKTFVAGLLSMSELTYYAVPSGVLARLQSVPSAISHALMPVLSETRSRDGAQALADIYIRSARALFALSLPALGLLFVFMPQLLGLWLGPTFSEHAAAPARLLVIAQAFALAYHAPNALAGGLGGGRQASVTGWAQALMSLALWPFLIPRWGILGAAVGAVVAQVIPTILYLDATHRTLIQLSWKKFSEEAVMPLIVPTAVLLIIAWVGRPWAWSWPGFLCVNALAGGAYAALTYRALPVDDRNAAARWLGFKGT